MGCSHLADALTGLAIPQGEPVVALVVERRTSGYPDATTHAAMAPLSASQSFEPLSLPIRAKAGDYADIEPNKGDLGATLLMDLANKSKWSDLAAAGFGYNASILLGAAARGKEQDDIGFPVDKEPRVLGLVVFREDTWKRIVDLGSTGSSRNEDIDTVLSALSTVRKAVSGGDNDMLGMNMGLTRLSSSCLYEKDPDAPRGIKTTHLPRLARALSGREGGDLLSGMATDGLGKSNVLGTRLLRDEPGPNIPKVLGMVWDLQAAERGMDALCRTWQPSYGAGQHDNAPDIANSSLETLADASGRMLSVIEEGMSEENSVLQLEALLSRMDEIRAEIVDRLVSVREDMPTP